MEMNAAGRAAGRRPQTRRRVVLDVRVHVPRTRQSHFVCSRPTFLPTFRGPGTGLLTQDLDKRRGTTEIRAPFCSNGFKSTMPSAGFALSCISRRRFMGFVVSPGPRRRRPPRQLVDLLRTRWLTQGCGSVNDQVVQVPAGKAGWLRAEHLVLVSIKTSEYEYQELYLYF
jgi:hypothetical protein